MNLETKVCWAGKQIYPFNNGTGDEIGLMLVRNVI